jgi:hypothetical protein
MAMFDAVKLHEVFNIQEYNLLAGAVLLANRRQFAENVYIYRVYLLNLQTVQHLGECQIASLG